MRIMKRWLTLMLTMSLALSDCGGITAFAAGNDLTVESLGAEDDEERLQLKEEEITGSDEISDDDEFISNDETEESENTNVSSEDVGEDEDHEDTDSAQDEDTVSEADSAQDENTSSETDTEEKLPSLHIGQINAEDELPSPDDSEFEYDLPVSFEMSDSVVLFVHHNMDEIIGKEEGTLVWSILRGENGMEEGSLSLVNEEDDWTDFEIVTESPYFIMTENEDKESEYYQTVELTVKDVAADEEIEDYKDYRYYIRAAYYFGTGEEMDEEFYAASTIAFLPIEDADIDEVQDDALDADGIQDDESAAEAADEEILDNALRVESDLDAVSEENNAENGDKGESTDTEEKFAEDQDDSYENTHRLVLLVPDGSAEGTIPMYIDGDSDKKQILITAKIETKDNVKQGTQQIQEEQDNLQVDTQLLKIVWKSSSEKVATVTAVDGPSGADTVGRAQITAKAEGYAQITAEYKGLKASVMVDVVRNEEAEKLLDLSGDIWVAGFQQESDDLVYTGKKITQDIRVYCGETLLKQKTDYTLTYKNNINAAAYNSAKAPAVTIKFKGQYSGSRTLYFTIKQRELDESMSYEQVVSYAKTLNIAAPTLNYNNKKLASKKDFTCDYSTLPPQYKKGASYVPGDVYHYKVKGIGNFTGEIEMDLVVLNNKNYNMNSATITLDQKQYKYHGERLTTADVGIVSVKFGKNAPLDPSLYQYDVFADGVGTGYIEVSPSETGRSEGYRGKKKVNIKVVGDRNIKDAKTKVEGSTWTSAWKNEIVFSQTSVKDNGGMIQAKEGLLAYYVPNSDADDSLEDSTQETDVVPEILVEGRDYTVKYGNHKKVGTATATFTGKGRYKGTFKIKYKITPNRDPGNFTITWKNVKRSNTDSGELEADEKRPLYEIAYQKGGAVPNFALMDQDGNILNSKTDYTVKLTNNKKANTTMTCTITGKGNYKGFVMASKDIWVTPANIGQGTISVSDKQSSTKAAAWKSTPTIKDVNGKKLAAGTDYEKVFKYSVGDEIINSNPGPNTTVTITVTGKNNYEGSSISCDYRIYQTDISKLKVTIDAQTYTGEKITLTPTENIHVYTNSSNQKKKINQLSADYYEIVEYKNNIKAGTAKVTLRGKTNYGGMKTYGFKINKKAYLVNQVKGITLDKSNLVLSIQGDNTAKGKFTATITAKNAKEKTLTNSTVIWSTSNRNVATVEGTGSPVEVSTKDTATGTTSYKTTVTAQITLLKAGTVKITAATQDGNKKATCTITVVDVPIIKDPDTPITIKMSSSSGSTHKLKFEKDDPDLSGVAWTNSNDKVVSVNKTNGELTAHKAGAVVLKLTDKKTKKFVQQCYVVVEDGNEEKPDKYYEFKQRPGSTDDTDDIRNDIIMANQTETSKNSGVYKYDGIYIPAGVYRINATKNAKYGIFLDGRDPKETWNPLVEREHFEIRMSPGALLMVKGNKSDKYHVITIYNCKNITISGGTIIGERDEHTGKGGEWGHGIAIYDSENITITGMDISKCWGDGIYLGTDKNKSNKKINITNCNVHHNRRNNLGITSANGVTIDNCHFNYANGTDPQFGIDIETNDSKRPCQNITITNTEMIGNKKASMGIMTNANNVTLKNCTLDGIFYNWAGKDVTLINSKPKGGVINNSGYITTVK